MGLSGAKPCLTSLSREKEGEREREGGRKKKRVHAMSGWLAGG